MSSMIRKMLSKLKTNNYCEKKKVTRASIFIGRIKYAVPAIMLALSCGTDEQHKSKSTIKNTRKTELKFLSTKITTAIKSQIILSHELPTSYKNASESLFNPLRNDDCFFTWVGAAKAGAVSGAIGANVISKTCTGTGVIAGVLTSGGGLALAAACVVVDTIELDTMIGMITGSLVGGLVGIKRCNEYQITDIRPRSLLSPKTPVFHSIIDKPMTGTRETTLISNEPKEGSSKKQNGESKVKANQEASNQANTKPNKEVKKTLPQNPKSPRPNPDPKQAKSKKLSDQDERELILETIEGAFSAPHKTTIKKFLEAVNRISKKSGKQIENANNIGSNDLKKWLKSLDSNSLQRFKELLLQDREMKKWYELLLQIAS